MLCTVHCAQSEASSSKINFAMPRQAIVYIDDWKIILLFSALSS